MTMSDEEKRKFGPSGSMISPDSFDYYIRIRLPLPRLPEEMSAEEFKEILESQDKTALKQSDAAKKRAAERLPMTTDRFMNLLTDPTAKRKRQARSEMKRIADALEYHQGVDIRFWENEQMKILEALDKGILAARMSAYNSWKTVFTDRVKRSYKKIYKEDPELAKAFAKYAYDFIEKAKPRKKQAGSMVIIRQVRRMAIRNQTSDLLALGEDLSPILTGKTKAKKVLKASPKRKPKGVGKSLVPGHTDIHDLDKDKEEE